ncbi:MAG: hypothetical protein HYW02_02130 [Deltaproteobacteria bacterium]|nr:hypothetical protein [Deltaproteobacteria bacterium]
MRAITSNLLVYVDKEASDNIKDDEIEELALNFDQNSIPLERDLFGNESDLNNDGYISVLMSGVTNGMASSGGIVTGFFFPADLYSKRASNPCSNEQEIFYTLVPDPKGEFGVPITAEFATQNILPGVLCHEYQHMISFNRHALLGEGKTEEPWLNEAISHLAEDLCGYGLENYSRVKLFLDKPNTTSLVPTTSPSLAERGAGYLFLRYLYEQQPKGEAFLRNLLEGNSSGAENIVASFGDGEFADLLNRWSLTLALSELGLTSDSKYNYQTPFKHSVTGNRSGICLRCDAEDGRGTILKGPAMAEVDSFPIAVNLNATSSQILIVSDPPSSLGIIGTGGPNLTGTMLRLVR